MKLLMKKSVMDILKTKAMELKGIRRILDIYENKTKTMEKKRIDNWGVFVENEQLETYEIRLPQKLAQKVWDFIENSDKHDLIGENTNGNLNW